MNEELTKTGNVEVDNDNSNLEEVADIKTEAPTSVIDGVVENKVSKLEITISKISSVMSKSEPMTYKKIIEKLKENDISIKENTVRTYLLNKKYFSNIKLSDENMSGKGYVLNN